jgi:hypothetical protein
LWEPKIATLVNVHEHGRTLPLVAVGDNRIGKVSSSVSLSFRSAQSDVRSGSRDLLWLLCDSPIGDRLPP